MTAAIFYTLDAHHQVVATDDPYEWAAWLSAHLAEVILADSQVGSLQLSTVFLGFSVRAVLSRVPVDLFESLIVAADPTHPLDHACWRYNTWDEAVHGHASHLYELTAESLR